MKIFHNLRRKTWFVFRLSSWLIHSRYANFNKLYINNKNGAQCLATKEDPNRMIGETSEETHNPRETFHPTNRQFHGRRASRGGCKSFAVVRCLISSFSYTKHNCSNLNSHEYKQWVWRCSRTIITLFLKLSPASLNEIFEWSLPKNVESTPFITNVKN